MEANPSPMTQKELLRSGRLLPVMEEFYSLQGEGFHTGTAAWFIRIGGCDVGCSWCDVKESWNASLFPPVETDKVIEQAAHAAAGAVVVTGGEPLQYNLDYLCARLTGKGIRTFLETSGSQPLSGTWHWICLSPKKEWPPLAEFYPLANELKVIINKDTDLEWAEEQRPLVTPACHLYLQPEWSRKEFMTPGIIRYILSHPYWKLSLQTHKYLGIP